jgi:hypothetical protein
MHQRNRHSVVFWKGRQWAVTGAGLESQPPYDIVVFAKERLSQPDDDFRYFAIVANALRFSWLDVDEFQRAWSEAQRWHTTSFDDVPFVWRAALENGTRRLLHDSNTKRSAA